MELTFLFRTLGKVLLGEKQTHGEKRQRERKIKVLTVATAFCGTFIHYAWTDRSSLIFKMCILSYFKPEVKFIRSNVKSFWEK